MVELACLIVGVAIGTFGVVPEIRKYLNKIDAKFVNQQQVNLNLNAAIERAYLELSQKVSDAEVENLILQKLKEIAN